MGTIFDINKFKINFMKDYYKVLGVDKKASQDEIKKAYRKKAVQTHPDKHGGDDTEFKEINEAYQVLGDEKNRKQYDMGGMNSNFSGQGGFDIHDIFSSFGNGFDPFDMFFRGGGGSGYHENLDLMVNVDITLHDVYNNTDKTIKFNRNVTCDVCNGTGFDPDSDSHQCDVCGGDGRVWEPMFGYQKCKYCQGSGRIHTGTCKKCNGKKVIEKKEEFKLNNIYKIRSSDRQILRGYGNQSKYYLNKIGNLVLNINYLHDNKYKLKEDGLYYRLDLHYEDAINGMNIEYKHLDNKKYKLKIPKKTNDGDILRMKGKGLLINGKVRQDLFVKINIIIDYNRL